MTKSDDAEEHHRVLLTELWRLWDSEPNSEDASRFEELSTLVDEYERKKYPI